jgi:hypothetical protein
MKYKKRNKTACIRVRLDELMLEELNKYCLLVDTTKSNFIRALLLSYMSDLKLDMRANDKVFGDATV